MKKLYTISILAFILFTGCQKDSSSISADDCLLITKENIIGRYRITVLEEKQDNGSIKSDLAQMPACEQNDIYNFSSNGVFIEEANKLKCSSNQNNISTRNMIGQSYKCQIFNYNLYE